MFHLTKLHEILKPLITSNVKQIVEDHKSDHYRKSYKTQSHMHLMVFHQLSGVNSLRSIEDLLDSHKSMVYHLGLDRVKRSTVSYANKTMDPAVFSTVASLLIDEVVQGRKIKKEMRELLCIIDSSTITSTSTGDGWSKRKSNCTQGLKLHAVYEPEENIIEYIDITEASINDIIVGKEIPLESNRIYVFDKGYLDYNWWHTIDAVGSTFVSRLKKDAAYNVIQENTIKKEDKGFIKGDQIITFKNKMLNTNKKNEYHGKKLRIIKVIHPDPSNTGTLNIVSNDCERDASEIAGFYKKRWAVELLFKWLKQNLRMKSHLSTSKNGLKIQIYCAIIAFALLKLYEQKLGQIKGTFKQFLEGVKHTLFTRPEYEEKLRRRQEKAQKVQPSFLTQEAFWEAI